jgi:uncharacterized membrane protein (UPF0136 family)
MIALLGRWYDRLAQPAGQTRRYPRIATFFAATIVGSVLLGLFLTLVVLVISSLEESDPDRGLQLISIAVTLPVFALVVFGAAKLIRRDPAVGTLGVVLGIVVLVISLFFLRNALREECGFGGPPPTCDLSDP